MDLFTLYVLFSHFRPRDLTLENSFFQMSSYARAYVCITHMVEGAGWCRVASDQFSIVLVASGSLSLIVCEHCVASFRLHKFENKL